VPSRDGRNEGDSLEDMILPLTEVIDFIYNSKGEHELRVEDPTRVRALIGLIGKMKDLLETPKEEVEKEFGECFISGANNDSGEACSTVSEAVCSEYTVRSVVSWKERMSWFYRPACGKKRSCH
jgi:hypothetical protein